MKIKSKMMIGLLSLFILNLSVLVGDDAGELVKKLKTLPSTNAPHIKKIKSMKPNSWLNLGRPEGDKKWGVARGRSWAPKMAYVPKLSGALFCGEGVHGYIKPNGRIMDDLWFYDANQNKWICLFPGNVAKSLKRKIDKNGFEVNEKGDFVPLAYLGHAYNNLTYIPESNKLMIVWVNSQYWQTTVPHRYDWLKDRDGMMKAANAQHPVYFNLSTGKWERQLTTGKGPQAKWQGVVEYIPSKKKVFYQYRDVVWFFDIQKNTWEKTKSSTKIGYDSSGCFDTKRNRMMLIRNETFVIYDIKTGEWHNPESQNQPKRLPRCADGTFYYDSVNDVAVAHVYKNKTLGNILVYDIQKNTWVDKGNLLTPVVKNNGSTAVSGFYHDKLNVHFYYIARDSRNEFATMYAYRYK